MGFTTCRYRYGGRYCAHSAVEERICMGEDKCAALSPEGERLHRAMECSHDQWFGLYCAKYRRFYCAGKENCTTPETYMAHLLSAKTAQWRP